VTFLPYLQGERTPHRDASLRGALVGLSLAHTRAHLTRAVLEGVCFAMRDSLEILRGLGLAPAELLLTGGGARSPFLRRLQADVYGVPVRTADREEGPAYGAALLAAVGAARSPTSPPPRARRSPGRRSSPPSRARTRPTRRRTRASVRLAPGGAPAGHLTARGGAAAGGAYRGRAASSASRNAADQACTSYARTRARSRRMRDRRSPRGIVSAA
jgi:xylulokinase